MDDDLEADRQPTKDVIDIMAFITMRVFNRLNIKTTIKSNDSRKVVRYLG